MSNQNNGKLIELIELLRRPMYAYTMSSRNDRKGSPKATENALGEIELLIYAYAKTRVPEIDEALKEMSNGTTEPSA